MASDQELKDFSDHYLKPAMERFLSMTPGERAAVLLATGVRLEWIPRPPAEDA